MSPSPVADSTVRVVVTYTFREYKQILSDYLRCVEATEANAGRSWLSRAWNSRPVQQLALALVLPPIFALKKLRVGSCTFEFSTEGLTRTSKGRTGVRTWQQVRTVHQLPLAYLIELEEGALPLPYRVFTPAQRAMFEQLLPSTLQQTAAS
jgi:hypothetical protein